MCEKEKLMGCIQTYSFAVLEAVLYLDGHPNDEKAISYYNKYRDLALQATEDYEKKFGPITYYGNDADCWEWVKQPWPWEMEAN